MTEGGDVRELWVKTLPSGSGRKCVFSESSQRHIPVDQEA